MLKIKGYVTEICDTTFWADISCEDGAQEIVEILKEKVSFKEYDYIILGAYFTWTIYDNGEYDFVFCKEKWTSTTIEKIKKMAKSWYEKLKWEL